MRQKISKKINTQHKLPHRYQEIEFRLGSSGFTLIELLVVVTIIGFLATASIISLDIARQRAKYAKAKQEISVLAKAMKNYEMDVGELPPRGDSCSACYEPPHSGGQSSWNATINALLYNDGANWSGPYLVKSIYADPWGNYYLYDDNACNSNCGDTYLTTAGSDGRRSTGDEYGVLITLFSEISRCCY